MAQPDHDHSNILRKTPGLTNLFHSNVRRSRSLASLQREEEVPPPPQLTIANIGAMRSRQALGAYNSFSEGPAQTGLRPPMRSNKSLHSAEGSVQLPKSRWYMSPSMQQENHTRTPSAPSRPKPAPRLWTEDDDEPDIKLSLLGLDANAAAARTPQPPQIMWQPPQSTSPLAPYSRNPRSPSPLNQSQSQRDRSLSRRRQPNVSDLELNPLSTLEETSNESPSFPRPRSIRNMSDPTFTPRVQQAKRESLTPRADSGDDKGRAAGTERSPITVEMAGDLVVTPQQSKRASSMLLPFALAPLITSSPPQASQYNITSPEGEKPPVPPKDSIYAHFPSSKTNTPRPEQGPMKAATPRPDQDPHSNSSSISQSVQSSSFSENDYTVSSSVTTLSPIEFPSMWPVELPSGEDPLSPKSQHRNNSQSRNNSHDRNDMPWVMKEYKAVPARKPVASTSKTASSAVAPQLSIESTDEFSVRDFPVLSPPEQPSAESPNSHNDADSVLNRGRPTRRSPTHRVQRTISREVRLANITGADLPEGHNKIQALTTFSQERLFIMRREADSEASGYEVLDQRDVDKLRDEENLLDGHCNKLRRQGVTLRQQREQLHLTLLNFLKSAGNPVVSREYVLQQTSELSELDQQIDEAANKLEAAQDRRVRVQRCLLEHTAATLALVLPGTGVDEQTPPRSPSSHDYNSGPASIMIAMDAQDMMFSPPDENLPHGSTEAALAAAERAETERVEAEERAYHARVQHEREETERRELAEQQDAERQQQELERELFRQQEERESPKSSSTKNPTPRDTSPSIPKRKDSLMKPVAPSAGDSDLEMLSQQRYQPPSSTKPHARSHSRSQSQSPQKQAAETTQQQRQRTASPSQSTPRTDAAIEAAAIASSTSVVGAVPMQKQPSRNEVQSIQVYADEDVYASQGGVGGMESLLSSIEQEIDAMEGKRATMVF